MDVEWAVSIRRACAAIVPDPRTYRYKSHRPGQAALEQRIRVICQTRVLSATGPSTFCCDGRAGSAIGSRPIAFTRRWACNCVTSRPNDGFKPSRVMIVPRLLDPTMSGPWIFSVIN